MAHRIFTAALVMFLLLVAINFGGLFGVIKILHINSEGAGPLKITQDGVELKGVCKVKGDLVATKILSRPNAPLQLESETGVSLYTENSAAGIFLDRHFVNISANQFFVKNQGSVLLSVSEKGVFIDSPKLEIMNDQGYKGNIHTSLVKSKKNLNVESTDSQILMYASKGINLDSGFDGTSFTSYGNININAIYGTLTLNALDIQFTNLTIVDVDYEDFDEPNLNVGELCTCSDGRTFAVSYPLDCTAGKKFCAKPRGI